MTIKLNTIAAVLCLLLVGCGAKQAEQAGESSQSTSKATESAPDSPQNTASQAVYEGTINGVISDSMCGSDHSKMGALGKDPAACSKKCAESGAKYVLVDKNGDSYALSDQKKASDLAGQTVAITGHIDPAEKSIHVHSIVSE